MIEDVDKASKLKGFYWLMAGVFIAAGVAFGITPLVRIIPWSWEKNLAQSFKLTTVSNACGYDVQKDAVLKKFVARIYPLDDADKKFSIDVQIIKDPVVNAFAGLGGDIRINSGILDQAESAEEVAGVLAHEIEHVRRRHILEGFVIRMMTAGGMRMIFSGDSPNGANWSEYFMKMDFSRSQEAEADEGGLIRLQKAHVDNSGFKNFFDRMKKASVISALLSDHPSSTSRVEMADKFRNEQSAPILSDEEWKTLKAYCG